MSKQTAVEWLKKELEEYGSSSHLSLDWETFDELVEQAKAMEREQIEDAYGDGVNAYRTEFCNRDEYFKLKYGKEQNDN